MIIYETGLRALPPGSGIPSTSLPTFWDSSAIVILAVLECALDAFLKGKELKRKPEMVCHRDIKNSSWPYLNCYSQCAISRKQILFSDSINHSELFYLQPLRMDNLTLT